MRGGDDHTQLRRFRPGHALHYLPRDTRVLIDVGCNAGEALADAAAQLGTNLKRLIGVDINPRAVENARARLSHIAQAEVHHTTGDSLPVESASVDTAMCLEVIEHVPAHLRPAVIAEIARVVRPGGTLILTTPHAGMFDWLDPENGRFYAGALYRPVSQMLGGISKDHGYTGQKHGVVEHYHFTLGQLRRLLGPTFTIEKIRFRGCLAFPLATWLIWPLYRTGTSMSLPGRVLRAVQAMDSEIDWGRTLGYNVLMVARRCA